MKEAKTQSKDTIQQTLEKLKNQATPKENELLEVISSMYESYQETKNKAAQKVSETAHVVNDSVHHSPWNYIGGAALVGFFIGFVSRR